MSRANCGLKIVSDNFRPKKKKKGESSLDDEIISVIGLVVT